MAERRMFAKTIIGSDSFLEMPQSTQNLYFHFSMNADDDGFVANPKSIMRSVGAKEDDMKVLLAKQFVFGFESGIVVIKHWKIHNYLRSDRYKSTQHTAEKSQISTAKSGEYVLGIPSDNQMATQVRLGKVRLGKCREESERVTAPSHTRYAQPTLEEINFYCLERQNNVNPQKFFDFYAAKGWFIGKNPMRDWRAAVRTWEQRVQYDTPTPKKAKGSTHTYAPGELGRTKFTDTNLDEVEV